MKYLLIILFVIIGFSSCLNNIKNEDKRVFKQDKSLIDSVLTKSEAVLSNKNHQISKIGNSIGVIVLTEKITKNDTIKIYNKDGSLWHMFTYYYDDSDGKYDFYNEEFRPFSFHPDYFLLALKVTDDVGDSYRVVVNESEGLKKFLRKTNHSLKFQTWEEHILSLFSVGFNYDKNIIKTSPNNESESIKYDSDEFYHPSQIKGKWLQVKWGSEGSWNYGWIKWREKEKLLIELFYFA